MEYRYIQVGNGKSNFYLLSRTDCKQLVENNYMPKEGLPVYTTAYQVMELDAKDRFNIIRHPSERLFIDDLKKYPVRYLFPEEILVMFLHDYLNQDDIDRSIDYSHIIHMTTKDDPDNIIKLKGSYGNTKIAKERFEEQNKFFKIYDFESIDTFSVEEL